MEGGVFEDERIIGINGIGNKRGREDDEKQDDKMGRLGKRPSGIVVMDEYSYSGDEMINGVKYEEEKTSSTPTSASTTPIATSGGGGGLFNQLITNLVNSPKSDGSKGGHGGDHEEVVKKNDGVVEENGGLEDNKENAAAAAGGGGGGESFVDDIVAKLPRTLSEDTVKAPEPDEASILLHSIIHD